MKKILAYLRQFVKEDFHLYFYLYTTIFIGTTIAINYLTDFENTVIDTHHGTGWHFLSYFLFYSFAYYAVALPLSVLKKERFHRSATFWIKSLLFLLILAADGSFDFHGGWIGSLSTSPAEYVYMYGLINNIYPAFIYLPLLGIAKVFYDRKTDDGLYGLSFKRFHIQPYLLFLLLMTPLIFTASFQQDFQESYPEAQISVGSSLFGLASWQSTLLFETCYLLDFTWVELLFRGAMVIGLSSVMGRNTVLPMVATYAFLHFGKPAGEAIASVFGGYILGVIALYSRNILGGVMIHMGIAFLMELMAFVQLYYIKN